jgi:hypothetical protein
VGIVEQSEAYLSHPSRLREKNSRHTENSWDKKNGIQDMEKFVLLSIYDFVRFPH